LPERTEWRVLGTAGRTREHIGEGSPTLVGRARELAVIEDHLVRSAGGEARTVVVTGEAGAGKSVFLDAVRRRP
jgi:transcriptional regulator with PAS, ATPase and Fis domain